jgi:hypothetical protein
LPKPLVDRVLVFEIFVAFFNLVAIIVSWLKLPPRALVRVYASGAPKPTETDEYKKTRYLLHI